MAIYAGRIRQALTSAFDVRALAAAWIALHPGGTGDTSGPVLSAFLGRAREAITTALSRLLPQAWTEGWVLGQQSAEAVTAGVTDVDWGAWTPGDYEAAAAIAGPGLRQLLGNAGIVIQSIAQTRLEELSAVLEQTLASDVTQRPFDEPVPPMLSVSNLAAQLKDVLDMPSRVRSWWRRRRSPARSPRRRCASTASPGRRTSSGRPLRTAGCARGVMRTRLLARCRSGRRSRLVRSCHRNILAAGARCCQSSRGGPHELAAGSCPSQARSAAPG